MATLPQDKLDTMTRRFDSIEAALASGPSAEQFVKLSKEYAELEPIVRPIHEMIARAGGLDQGNIILNLADAEQRSLSECILFLAGSAINSIKNSAGKPDPKLGAEAMQQALEVHRSGELRGIGPAEHLAALTALAERRGLKALREALRQRYP